MYKLFKSMFFSFIAVKCWLFCSVFFHTQNFYANFAKSHTYHYIMMIEPQWCYFWLYASRRFLFLFLPACDPTPAIKMKDVSPPANQTEKTEW